MFWMISEMTNRTSDVYIKRFVEVSTERRIYRPKANSIEFEKATPQIPIVMLN
jgi:hypothetical protein